MTTIPAESIKFAGTYKVQVVKADTKEIVKDFGWQKNLILNGGMNIVASNYVANLNAAGICGTGSRPNYITSSTSTITQSGHTLHLYERTGLTAFTESHSTYTSSVNVGDVIQYGNGTTTFVMGIIDAFNLLVYPSASVDLANSQSFTIWKTSQDDLEGEVKRSTTYTTGLANCSTYTETAGSNVVFFKRTYDFTAESSLKNYTEIGVSWTGTRGSGRTTTARAVLPAPVAVDTGFQLRLVHILRTEWQPTSSVYFTASISGWPVAPATDTIATQSMQNFSSSLRFMIATFGSSGGVTGYSSYWSREPASTYFFSGNVVSFIGTNSTPLAPFNSAVNRTSGASYGVGNPNLLNTSRSGSYSTIKYFDYGLNDANSTDLRCMGYGFQYGGTGAIPTDTTGQAFTVVFRQPQTKTNLQTMRIAFQYTWDRVLT